MDEEKRVIDLYHRSDVTFIALAGDAEQTMSNLNMKLSDILNQRRGGWVSRVGVGGGRAVLDADPPEKVAVTPRVPTAIADEPSTTAGEASMLLEVSVN